MRYCVQVDGKVNNELVDDKAEDVTSDCEHD